MRDVAEAVRADVRAAISPIPLYPYRRISPPTMHVQMYAGSEAPGRPAMYPERDGVLYLHIYAVREEDVDSLYAKLGWLDGHRAAGTGEVRAISYRLESATLLQEDDGTLHLACLFGTRYYRNQEVA
jgi:hypothetical protein